jgi:hypothetical protein
MEIEKAQRKGTRSGWAIRISGENLLIAKTTACYIYTDHEHFRIMDYKPEDDDTWMPLPQCPKYIPDEQNHNWYRSAWRKFNKEETADKIRALEWKIAREIIDKPST